MNTNAPSALALATENAGPSLLSIDERSGNGIRAMLTGLTVLQAIGGERDAVPLKTIAAATNLTPSRAHRYLSSLVAAGFVEQDAASGHYGLGKAVIELGLLALGRLDPIQIGIDALVRLSAMTGLDGHLSVWGTHGPTVVRWHSGNRGYQIRIEEGRVLSLLWSATGRLFLAHHPTHETRTILQKELDEWHRDAANCPVTMQEVDTLSEKVVAAGFTCSLNSPMQPGHIVLEPVFPRRHSLNIQTISAPIFDRFGEAVMALTMFGADDAPLGDGEGGLVHIIRTVAKSASRRLGGGDGTIGTPSDATI